MRLTSGESSGGFFERCPGFGTNGEVDLSEGMGAEEKGYYFLTSAPTIVRGKVIVGGSVLDGQHTGRWKYGPGWRILRQSNRRVIRYRSVIVRSHWNNSLG